MVAVLSSEDSLIYSMLLMTKRSLMNKTTHVGKGVVIFLRIFDSW